MIYLLIALVVLAVCAGVTFYALLTTEEGVENETGFHSLAPAQLAPAKKSEAFAGESDLPTMLPSH